MQTYGDYNFEPEKYVSPVDYALFIGEKMVAVVEAKRKHKDISSVIDEQCRDYASNIKSEHSQYVINKYGKYYVPFLFATNGREYFKQYEEKSGVWFLDAREQFNAPKALSFWSSPEGMEEDLERDIENAEEAIASKQNAILLAMATGIYNMRDLSKVHDKKHLILSCAHDKLSKLFVR